MRFFIMLFLLPFTLMGLEVGVKSENISNGRTVLLEITEAENESLEGLEYGEKTYKIYSHPLYEKKSFALLPLSYYEKLGEGKAFIKYKKNGKKVTRTLDLVIKDGKYLKEKIQVNSSKVNPKSKSVKERISREYAQAMKIYNTHTQKNYLKTPFIKPLESFITSDFGKARVYNGSLKGYHSGTDFRASVGTPIVASNDGVIALVADRFYSGGTVLINHGRGIYTCYFHMSGYSVVEGQEVQKGQKIGLSGDTGRVTGPHLHFAVRIDGIQVDPLQFIEIMNKNILQKG
jgi:murein DD-endopeptidase MepM/ murein hydrolase activator NlpD